MDENLLYAYFSASLSQGLGDHNFNRNMTSSVRVIRLPASLRLVQGQAIEFQGHLREDIKGELYVPNPETVFEPYSVTMTMGDITSVTVFAPAGSTAEKYVEDRADLDPRFNGHLRFAEWSE